jgi:hypothetical protein
VHSNPPAPSSINPELGSAVDAALMRGLSKDPKLRWASCAEMVGAIESALSARPPAPAQFAASQTVVMQPPMPVAPPPPLPTPIPVPAAGTTWSSIAPPPADIPEIRYVRGRAAQVRGRTRRAPRFLIWIAAAIAVVVVLGTAGILVYAGLQPVVSVSPSTAHPGDQLLVTARNVPGGQDGQIQAFGTSQDFTAASSGDVSVFLNVPPDTGSGRYTVSVCWDGSCHASATVTIQGSAQVTPSAVPSPSPSPTAQASPLFISVSPRLGIVAGRTPITVTAGGLAPGAGTITIAQGTTRQFWDVVVAANGTVSKKIVLATTQPWVRGAAFVRVCDVEYRCTATVDITIG